MILLLGALAWRRKCYQKCFHEGGGVGFHTWPLFPAIQNRMQDKVRVIVSYEMNIPELFQFSRSRVLKSLFIIHPIVYFFQGLIYRFEFLMVVTVLCAGLTVVFFIITNVNEAQWKFGEEESTVEISSEKHVFITGAPRGLRTLSF